VDKGVAALSFFLRQGQVAAAAGVPAIWSQSRRPFFGAGCSRSFPGGLWYSGGLVSDIFALPLLCLGLWRGVVGRVRAALQRSFPD
jgi:hypothetical protein